MHNLGKSFLGNPSRNKNLQLLDDDCDSLSYSIGTQLPSFKQDSLLREDFPTDTVLQLDIPSDNIEEEVGGGSDHQATLSSAPKTDRRKLMVKAFSFTSRKTIKKISHIGEVDQDVIRKKLEVIQEQQKAVAIREEEVAATSEHTTSTIATISSQDQQHRDKSKRRPPRSRSVPRFCDTAPEEGKLRRRSRRSCSNPKVRSSSSKSPLSSKEAPSRATERPTEGPEASTRRKSRRGTSRTANRSERTSSRAATTTTKRPRPRHSKSTEEGGVVPPPPGLNRATTAPDQKRRPRSSKSTVPDQDAPPLRRKGTDEDQKRRSRPSKSTDPEQDVPPLRRKGTDEALKRRSRPSRSTEDFDAVPAPPPDGLRRATTAPDQKRKSRSSKKPSTEQQNTANPPLRRVGTDEAANRISVRPSKSTNDADVVPPPPSEGLQRATTAPVQKGTTTDDDLPFALPNASSMSLLVDNAQSHAPTTRTNKNNKPRPSSSKPIEEEVFSKCMEEGIVFPPPLSGSLQRSSTDPQLISSSNEPQLSSANSSRALLQKRATAKSLRNNSDHNSKSRGSRHSDHNGSSRSLRYSEHGTSRSSRRDRSTSQQRRSTRQERSVVPTEQQEDKANISRSSSGPSLQRGNSEHRRRVNSAEEDPTTTIPRAVRPSVQRSNSERFRRFMSAEDDPITTTPRAVRPSIQRGNSERFRRVTSAEDDPITTTPRAVRPSFQRATSARSVEIAGAVAGGEAVDTDVSKAAETTSSRHQRRSTRMRPSSIANSTQIAQAQLLQLDRDLRIKQLARTENEKKEAIQLLQQKYGTEAKETPDEQPKTPKQKRGSKMMLLKTLFTGSERNLRGASNHSTEKVLPCAAIEGPMMTLKTKKRKSKPDLTSIENNKLEGSNSSGMDFEQRADPTQQDPATTFAVTA